jgi:zinc/manganese transport system substrate-binding protein
MAAAPASALDVFVCEPEWGSLVAEIAGADAEITVATTAFQDPHSLQARPSLIAAARSADLLVCSGADLEIGWLPLLLRRSGNPDIQPGTPGHFLAADFVRRLEIPQSIDRSQGDVHPQGNPHMHLHPRSIERVAEALAERLTELDPANGSRYRANAAEFLARWDEATYVWEQQAEDLRGMRLVSHHRSFSYLADWLGLDIVATLEANPPLGILRAPFENEKPSLWLSQRLDIPEIELPFTVGGNDETVDLFSLYDTTIRMLLEHRR